MFLLFNRLNEEIKLAKSILFVCHKNPDPDTVGGALALGAYAESLGKKTAYFCKDAIPENFLFISGVQKFGNNFEMFSGAHDLVIFTDCAELSRSGLTNEHQNPAPKPEENFSKNQFNLTETPSAPYVLGQHLSRGLVRGRQNWILIDHHPSRGMFADFEIRDAGISSTCEIIYNFLLHAGAKINGEMATALLSGILIDTNFLSNAASGAESVSIAAKLRELGADYRSVVKAFYFNKNEEVLKLWGLALSRLKHNPEKGLASTAIFEKDVGDDKNLDEALDGLSNFLNAVLKSNVIMVLKERPEGVRGSLRTNCNDIDVAKIAAEYGGGGHSRAAGFTCKGKLVERDNEWMVEGA